MECSKQISGRKYSTYSYEANRKEKWHLVVAASFWEPSATLLIIFSFLSRWTAQKLHSSHLGNLSLSVFFFFLQSMILAKKGAETGHNDQRPLPTGSRENSQISNSSSAAELTKLKEMLKQRDNEISILWHCDPAAKIFSFWLSFSWQWFYDET